MIQKFLYLGKSPGAPHKPGPLLHVAWPVTAQKLVFHAVYNLIPRTFHALSAIKNWMVGRPRSSEVVSRTASNQSQAKNLSWETKYSFLPSPNSKF